jgi:hypothetical protein
MSSYFFHYNMRDFTGKVQGGGTHRVEADTLLKAKNLHAKSYPDCEVKSVSEVIWEAPAVPAGPRKPGQAEKEAKARRASYAKLR